MNDPRWSWVIAGMAMVSLWLLTRRSRWGHAVGVAKELLFIAYALASSQYGFATTSLVFLVMFARGFMLWSRPVQPQRAAR